MFYSRWATPVMDRNQVVGAVYLYEEDSSQGALLVELQRNLRLISAVVCLAGLVLFGAFFRLPLPGGCGPCWGHPHRAGRGVHPPHLPARARQAGPAGR